MPVRPAEGVTAQVSAPVVAVYRPESVRPDLPIPLPPLSTPAELFRRNVIGLREPSFSAAYRSTIRWLAGAATLALTGQLAVTPALRPAVFTVALAAAGYAALRAFALKLFERWQARFESTWLAAQSEMLQVRAFEIVRFSVRPHREETDRTVRIYDLTRPIEVTELITRYLAERSDGRSSEAIIEFTYSPGTGDNPAIEVAHRALTDIEFVMNHTHPGAAWARFSQARYTGQPDPSPGAEARPATVARWLLAGPIQVSVVEAG